MNVCLAQLAPLGATESEDPRPHNVKRAVEAISRGAAQGANLVVFGEYYLSGLANGWTRKWPSIVDPPDEHIGTLTDVARANRVHLVLGATTNEPTASGQRFFNSALLIGPPGLIGVYHKCHLGWIGDGTRRKDGRTAPWNREGTTPERTFYASGDAVTVFDTALGRIGINVCYDFAYPEVTRAQVLKGADFVVNLAAARGGVEWYWDAILPARAAENMTWFAMSSIVPDAADYFGGSRIIDPLGQTVASAKHYQEDLVIHEVDLEVSHQARARSGYFALRQPEIYGAICESGERGIREVGA